MCHQRRQHEDNAHEVLLSLSFFCAGLCPGRGRGPSGIGRRGRHCLVVGFVVVAVVAIGSWSCGSGGGTAAAAFRVSCISACCSEWHVHALPLLHRSLRRLRWQSAAGADVHPASCLHLLHTANLRPYMLGLKFLAKLLFSLQVHYAWLARFCGLLERPKIFILYCRTWRCSSSEAYSTKFVELPIKNL